MKKLSWQGQRILDNSHRSLHSVAEEKDRERISCPAPVSQKPSPYKVRVFFEGGADFFSRQTLDVRFDDDGWEEVSSKDEAEYIIFPTQVIERICVGPDFYSPATAVEPKASEIGGEDLKKYLDEKGEIE